MAFFVSEIVKQERKEHAKYYSKWSFAVEMLKLIDERPRVRTFCYTVLLVIAMGVFLYTGAMFVEALAKLFRI